MKKYIPWLGAFGILIVIFGTIYTVAQQIQRMDANYPQIQIAEDAAKALNQGTKPETLTTNKVDINESLAPFIIIYNKSGNVVSGTGYLNGAVPTVPIGVLTASEGKDYNFVSWQPQSDVRSAVVSASAVNYYVLSGRSLREVEKNENKTMQLSLLGGVVATAGLVAIFVIKKQLHKSK